MKAIDSAKIADRIMANNLSAPLMDGSISPDDYEKCSKVVVGLCRAKCYEDAQQHAYGTRFNLGMPWSAKHMAKTVEETK